MILPKNPNRECLARLRDFLNNPQSEYTPREIWTDDFVEKRPWPFQDGDGREAFVKLLGEIHSAFADYHLTMPKIIMEDDDAAVRMIMTGTHTAPFQGIPAYNKHVKWEVIAHMKFRDGLIYEQETFRDWMELMHQLQWPCR